MERRPAALLLPLAGRRTPIATAIADRLIRDARVIRAVRQTRDGMAAAKEKLRTAGIADRPAAGLFGQLQNGAALADGNDILDQFRGHLRFDLIGVRKRRIATDRRASDPQHMGGRTCLALPRCGTGSGLGTAGGAEPVHLSNDCIASDTAEFRRDLT